MSASYTDMDLQKLMKQFEQVAADARLVFSLPEGGGEILSAYIICGTHSMPIGMGRLYFFVDY